jgi:hypothetical protein
MYESNVAKSYEKNTVFFDHKPCCHQLDKP